jgi:DNA mismatch repair protein MutL
MSDIIRLLPDSVANQIAAGEVIQRPASVVKELLENSVDAGADNITVNIKDAGKTLIQVIDNGRGMSETDARMSFERHATSKIKDAGDLFNIRTLGFRGEALASIAAVAEVVLRTRNAESELGTEITVSASRVESQESVSCPTGTNFSIKRLFFNVPARRKFLKSDSSELRNIIAEFQHVALVNPNIEFSLLHNNTEMYNLPKTNQRQRIIHVFGKSFNQSLINVNTETSIVKITGFIGKPEFAKKKTAEQYFFVNNRYMRHPYFNKAITKAYEQILAPDEAPLYFIFFETDPQTIDINIHPTKTEIKFENEHAIWQFLHATIRESLGKNNIVPTIDFNTEGAIQIPVINRDTEFVQPEIEVNPFFNPFDGEDKIPPQPKPYFNSFNKNNTTNWQSLYSGFENDRTVDSERFEQSPGKKLQMGNETSNNKFSQFKNKYILTPVKSGLMMIDQKRAHERILFEKFMKSAASPGIAQESLFPESIELSPSDYSVLLEIMDDLRGLGFDIRDFGRNTVVVNGYPATSGNNNPKEMLEIFLAEYKAHPASVTEAANEKIAASLAKASAIDYGKVLSGEEMLELFDKLFACELPNYSPSGKTVITILKTEEIEKRF